MRTDKENGRRKTQHRNFGKKSAVIETEARRADRLDRLDGLPQDITTLFSYLEPRG